MRQQWMKPKILCTHEEKKVALKRLRDTISDHQLLLPFLGALPEACRVETTQLEASLNLERSMVERLIGASYRTLSKQG